MNLYNTRQIEVADGDTVAKQTLNYNHFFFAVQLDI